MVNEPRPNKAAAIGDDCVPAVFTELSQITPTTVQAAGAHLTY
jgi:hypothetical protein